MTDEQIWEIWDSCSGRISDFARTLLSASKPAAAVMPEEVREALTHAAGGWRGAACGTRDDEEGERRSADYRRRAQVIENWLEGRATATVGELDPLDALRYVACRESAIERGLFATPEEYDAMVDDSLRKKGKEVLTGRGNNYGKKVAKDGSLYRAASLAAQVDRASILEEAARRIEPRNEPHDWTDYAKVRAQAAQEIRALAPAAPAQSGEPVALIDALLLEAEKFWWNDGPQGKSADAMNAAKKALIAAIAPQAKE